MTQVDLASVCPGGVAAACNDRKIACETLAGRVNPLAVDQPSDYPPESFVLSSDAAEDWIDRNGFIERKNSGRSSSANLNLIPNPNNPTLNSGSQRYSLTVKTKPSFLGLPKPQKAAYAETKCRKPVNIRLFPKRSSSSNSHRGKTMSEPSSPKVSCIGRVRSRRDRGRRKKNRQNQTGEPAMKRSRSSKSRKTGFWNNFRAIFRSKKGDRAVAASAAEALKKSRSGRKRDSLSGLSGTARWSVRCEAEPPSLGRAKRFSSGRRSDAWAADMEVDGAKSEPLDRGSIWQRRNGGGPPTEINVDRKWGSVAVGPVSV